MAASSYGDCDLVAAREFDRPCNVGRCRASHDHRWTSRINHSTPDPARRLIAFLTRTQNFTEQVPFEFSYRSVFDCPSVKGDWVRVCILSHRSLECLRAALLCLRYVVRG